MKEMKSDSLHDNDLGGLEKCVQKYKYITPHNNVGFP